MVPRKKSAPRTADLFLSSDVTESFLSDLESVLSTDDSFEAKYQLSMLRSKYADPAPGKALERRSAAINKWLAVELTNELTNERIRSFSRSDVVMIFEDAEEQFPRISSKRFFDKVADVVRQVIGSQPSLSYLHAGFSGGASTSKNRRHGHPAVKFLDKADVTRPALPLFREIIRGSRWADYLGSEASLEPRFVSGNVMFTVPKSTDIDRVAAKEPDLNMFLQKMFGNQIRSCLKRAGIDLNDQTRNGELARRGSIDGRLATIDLSSASDSVTYELVRRVLPEDWFYYLDLVRSRVTLIDGETHVNEMFSSMGNGFTFELESLLFYAIARSVSYFLGTKGTVSVYGDDIIVPVTAVHGLLQALSWAGFTPNVTKSFWETPFRESCGRHWYGGRDVSPFYVRGPFRRVSDLILTLNQLTSWSSRCLGIVDPRYEDLLLKYRQYVPEYLWGGQDLTSRSSLVTGDRPRKELLEVIETVPHDHIGGLIFWLFVAQKRQMGLPDGNALTTDGSSSPRFARLRKNRQQWTDLPVFLSRYGG